MNAFLRLFLDAVAAILHAYHRWRYGGVADELGREEGTEQGLLIVQIDGLSHDVLMHALRNHRLPTLSRMLEDGGMRLLPWYSDLPSSTPAAQAALMYGNRGKVPGFRWFDKEAGRSVVCKVPAVLSRLQEEISAESAGILKGGASYANMFDGDASISLFTLASLTGTGGLRGPVAMARLVALALSPVRLLRIVALSLWTYFNEVWRGVAAFFWPSKYGRLSLFSPLLHVVTDILVRELSTFSVLADLYRGAPSVYVNYSGYDEWAHKFGPLDSHALSTLSAIDRQIGQLQRMCRHTRRPYDMYVISDHGMTASVPFHIAFGRSLGEFVTECIDAPVLTDELELEHREMMDTTALLGYETKVAAEDLRGLSREAAERIREQLEKRAEVEPERVAARTDVVVRSSGSLSHLYFRAIAGRPATREELEAHYPGLVARLAGHAGIAVVGVRSEAGVQVIRRPDVESPRFRRAGRPESSLPWASVADDSVAALLRHEGAGDIVLLGAWGWWGRWDQVVTFEAQRGTHGGLGGYQCNAFLMGPMEAVAPLDGVSILRAEHLYHHFMGYQGVPGTPVRCDAAPEATATPEAAIGTQS